MVLPDGRRLAYSDLGDPEHPAVLLFHGTPGWRRYWSALPGFPFDVPLRFIAVDRPGYGDSDALPGGTYPDWPDDVAALADAIGLDRFAVLGGSGGGPGTLACALKIPDRLWAVVVVSCVGPPVPQIQRSISRVNRLAYRVADRSPRAMQANLQLLAWVRRHHPDALLRLNARKLSPADRAALTRPDVQHAVLTTTAPEAIGPAASGWTQDVVNQSRPWGFDVSDIAVPVEVWQPLDDTSAPPAVADYLQARLPRCTVHRIPHAGHLWHISHADQILGGLVTAISA